MDTEDLTIVHWLADIDELTVLCGNFQEGDKFTLDQRVLNCGDCDRIRKQRSNHEIT